MPVLDARKRCATRKTVIFLDPHPKKRCDAARPICNRCHKSGNEACVYEIEAYRNVQKDRNQRLYGSYTRPWTSKSLSEYKSDSRTSNNALLETNNHDTTESQDSMHAFGSAFTRVMMDSLQSDSIRVPISRRLHAQVENSSSSALSDVSLDDLNMKLSVHCYF